MKVRFSLWFFLTLAMAGSVMAESPDPSCPPPGIELPPGMAQPALLGGKVYPLSSAQLPFGSLEGVPETDSLDGCKLALEAYSWRNAEPPSSQPPGRLICLVTLSVRGLHPPATAGDFKPDRLWAFQEGEVWETPFTDERRSKQPPGKTEAVARSGPLWSGAVSVVVRIRHSETGQEIFLRAPDGNISFEQ
jgi:hypothetical protein